MRVSFVASGLDSGGAEFALLRLLTAMRRYDVDAMVVSLRSQGVVGPQLREASIPVACLDLPALGALISASPALNEQIRAWTPAVLHGWMYHGNLAASWAGLSVKLPVLWGIRQSLDAVAREKWLTRRVIKLGARFSARPRLIVYNSALARRQHETFGYAAEHAAVVPNGFDTEELCPDPDLRCMARRELQVDESAAVVAMVARFHPAKDYPTFLRAAALSIRARPSTMFVLVGNGVDESNRELASLVAQLGLCSSVRMLGRRDDVARLLPAFDVVCLTSIGESFPNALGEAMSCGVPCVGTAVGDVAELIGGTGEVVPPGDPEAVAAAIGRLLSLEPTARHALGAQARQRIIDRFSIGEVARRYADLLHSAAEQNH